MYGTYVMGTNSARLICTNKGSGTPPCPPYVPGCNTKIRQAKFDSMSRTVPCGQGRNWPLLFTTRAAAGGHRRPKKMLSKPKTYFFCSQFTVLQNFSLLLLFQEISEKILRWPQPPGATPHPPEATLAPLDVILHPPVVFRRPLCNFGPLYARYVGCVAPDGALLPLRARWGPWVATGHSRSPPCPKKQ